MRPLQLMRTPHVASEFVFQPFAPHEQQQRNVTVGMRSLWTCFTWSQRSCRRPHTVQLVVVVWVNRVASEIVFSSCVPKSHPEFHSRSVTVGTGTPWKLPFQVVLKMLLGVISVAKKLREHGAAWCWFFFGSIVSPARLFPACACRS